MEEDDIDLAVSEVTDPGYTACLVRPGPGLPSGILLAAGQGRGRQRFSIAHELGHYHIPTHQQRPTGWCGDEDMVAGAGSGKQYEWEANDFAAELLMPRTLFLADARQRDPVFREIVALAAPDMYDVSITAASLRYVELSDEACALVCSRSGTIEWVAKSDSFLYRIPWRGDALPVGSLARAVRNGERANDDAGALDPYVWLENEQRIAPELFESTLAVPRQDLVLSLVWVIPEEVDAEEGDHD